MENGVFTPEAAIFDEREEIGEVTDYPVNGSSVLQQQIHTDIFVAHHPDNITSVETFSLLKTQQVERLDEVERLQAWNQYESTGIEQYTRVGVSESLPLTYDPRRDTIDFEQVRVLKDTDPERYLTEMAGLKSRTEYNLETWMRERVLAPYESKIYEVRNNDFWINNFGKEFSMKEMMYKGRMWRIDKGTPESRFREAQEEKGMHTQIAFHTKEKTNDGAYSVSLSQPDDHPDPEKRVYGHNFVDIARKIIQDGKVYVEITRYNAGLSLREALDVRFQLKYGRNAPDLPDDQIPGASYHLGDPILLADGKQFPTSDHLFAFIHRNHQSVTLRDFEEVKQAIRPYQKMYTNIMERDPYDPDALRILNLIMNITDDVVDRIQTDRYDKAIAENMYAPTIGNIGYWESQEVRTVITDCGVSEGFDVPTGTAVNGSPLSVSDFAYAAEQRGMSSVSNTLSDERGPLTFQCPACKRMLTRDFGKLLEKCYLSGCPDPEAVACGPNMKKSKEKISTKSTNEVPNSETILVQSSLQKSKEKKKTKQANTQSLATFFASRKQEQQSSVQNKKQKVVNDMLFDLQKKVTNQEENYDGGKVINILVYKKSQRNKKKQDTYERQTN